VTLKLDRGLFALLSVLTVACRGEDPGTTDPTSSSSSGTSSDDTTGSTVPTTTGDDTSTGAVDPTTGEPEMPTTSNAANGFITTMTSTESGDPGPGPNGAECSSDDDCESMNCLSLFGGMLAFCADCNEDQDCVDAGTGTACTIMAASMNASCTDGPPGSTCMSDEACSGDQFCENVLDFPIIPDTCSECATSDDCAMGQLCSPKLDLQMFSGNKVCVEPGSVMNNELCPSGPDGPMACMSGHCTGAMLLNLIPVNICGECTEDTDCDMGETCMPAAASMAGVMGSVCG
jgi:hypothetical protein